MSIVHNISDDIIYAGQAKSFTLTFATPTNITGWTVEQRFRNTKNGTPVVTLVPTITDAVNGVMTLQLTAVQSRLLTGNTVFIEYWRTDSGSETPFAYPLEVTVGRTILSSTGL